MTNMRSAKIMRKSDATDDRLAIKLAKTINIKKVNKSQANAK
nr:hypothetical protein [Sulfurospirillum oryzae]